MVPIYLWDMDGHATGPARIAAGQRIYLKLWVDTNNNINFQGLNAKDFSTILFQGQYPTWNQVPANGNGVTINRQITYAANSGYRYDNSGYYVNNARYDRAYLYNTSTTSMYNSSNTTNHRGKFGAPWAPSSNVTINSNTHWYSENVSIDLT